VRRLYTVRVDEPDPKFSHMLLEQFGGANGNSRPQCNIQFRD
jgi:Mn-containing catalase